MCNVDTRFYQQAMEMINQNILFLAFSCKYFLSSSSLERLGAVVPPALLQGLVLRLPAGIQEADLCTKMIAQNEHFHQETTKIT